MLHLHDYFFEMPKNKISAILMQLLMVPLSQACQKLSKTIEPVHVKWILGRATAISLKKQKKSQKSENLRKFKQMAVARSIFTLGGRVQLFWTAFDMPVTGVPLEVALGYKKNCFLGVSKNNHASECQVSFFD